MKDNNMKEHILEAGMLLISTRGFKNTSISQILVGAGIPKGSFYYYFKNKEEFGLQLLHLAANKFFSSVRQALDSNLPPLKRLENYFDREITLFEGSPCRCSCLFGKLSQEMGEEYSSIRDELSQIFKNWSSLFENILREAVDVGELSKDLDTDVIARFIISGWEGALLQGKITKSIEPLKEFKIILLSILNNP